MTHRMKLNGEPFEAMKKGLKKIEMRLCDEKRSAIKIGDTIEFTHRETGERLITTVINLSKFPSFEELYRHFDKSLLGYELSQAAHPDDMKKYYSREEIEKYGVIGIEVKVSP